MADNNNGRYDWVLHLLIGIAEAEDGMPLPITLNVGGLLITGLLISEREFRQTFMFGEFEKGIQGAIKQLEESGDFVEPDKKPKQDDPHFIHLKDTKFFVPGQHPIPTIGEGALWRGRVAAVDGYILGTLGIGNPPSS